MKMGIFDRLNFIERRKEAKRIEKNRMAQIEEELLHGRSKPVAAIRASEIAREKSFRQKEAKIINRDVQLANLKRLEQDRQTKKAILEKRTALLSNVASNLGIKAAPKPIVKSEVPQELDQSKVNIGRITVFNRRAWNAEKGGIDFGSGNADLGQAAMSEPKLSPFNDTQNIKNVWKLGKEE